MNSNEEVPAQVTNVIQLAPHLDTVGENYKFDVNEVLEAAKDKLEVVTIIGETEDGELYLASSSNAGVTMIMLERAKHLIVFGE